MKAAGSGYTILVNNGTYMERLMINKKLTIKAAPGASPLVDGGGSGAVFSLVAGGVWLEGFTIRNRGKSCYGILISASGCTVINNVIDGGNCGIKINSGGGNLIDGNSITGATMGIFAYNTKNNVIRNNRASKNVIGIRLYLSVNNTITGNYAGANAAGLQADDSGSKNNAIYLNDFVGNTAFQAYAKGNNVWSSGTVNYVYNSVTFSGKLGNRYSDYSGKDPDGNGIGTPAYTKYGVKDQYPLADLRTKYTIVG